VPAAVLFDLDGTLSDSAAGILGALRYAFDVHGLPRLDARTERAILGPPFYETLPPLIGEQNVIAVMRTYRSRYGAGAMFDTTAYDGIPEVLRQLRAAGIRLAVATSKPEKYAVPIVEHLGLAEYFETVGGDDLAGTRRTKALVIGAVLHRLGDPDPRTTVMIGDREHDVLGARQHGIACIGAGWGYAQPGELERAGASQICAQPRDLLPALGLAAA
jgi:phosphoglycolate phosphatase